MSDISCCCGEASRLADGERLRRSFQVRPCQVQVAWTELRAANRKCFCRAANLGAVSSSSAGTSGKDVENVQRALSARSAQSGGAALEFILFPMMQHGEIQHVLKDSTERELPVNIIYVTSSSESSVILNNAKMLLCISIMRNVTSC